MVLKTPRSQFFTIRTDPKPANNLFIFFLTLSNQFFQSLTSTIQTPRASQMQLANRRHGCKEEFLHFDTAIKICFEKKAFDFQHSYPIKSCLEKAFALYGLQTKGQKLT